MAKTEEKTPEFEEGVEFDTFTPEPVAGKYDRHVQAMIAKDEVLEKEHPDEFAKGERTRVKILSSEEDKEKTVRQFQDSARKFGRTGRHIGTVPQGDGGVALQFVLGVRQSRPRKVKPETAENTAADTSDVPEETTAEAA